MKERLTDKDWHKTKVLSQKDDEATKRKKLHKLWELENAEEQGSIIRLPCKVGDTVYSIGIGEEREYMVKADVVWHFTIRDRVYITTDYIEEGILGIDVFLTCGEAEKKLAELKAKL